MEARNAHGSRNPSNRANDIQKRKSEAIYEDTENFSPQPPARMMKQNNSTKLPTKKVPLNHTNTGQQPKSVGLSDPSSGSGAGISLPVSIPTAPPSTKKKQFASIKSTNFVSEFSAMGRESLAATTHARFDDLSARRLQQSLTTESSEMKIRNLFAAFTVREESLNSSAINPAPVASNPSRNNNHRGKNMSRPTASSSSRSTPGPSNLDAENRRLKDAIHSFLTEFRALKDGCLTHEIHACNLFRDSNLELEKALSFISNVNTNEALFRKEIKKLQQQHTEMSEKFSDLKSTHSPVKNKAKEFEAKTASLIEDIQDLQEELAEKNALLERQVLEVAEAEKRLLGVREELLKTQSLQRETENDHQRNEKEVQRVQSELDSARDQLAQKDSDLRNALQSMSQAQTQFAEEKATLRAENSIYQTRLQALESERLTMTAELATRREEMSSATKEAQQLRDQIASLEGKIESKEAEIQLSKDLGMKIEVERELRARAELKLDESGRELLATSSQLLATQIELQNRVRDFEFKLSEGIAKLEEKDSAFSLERAEREAEKSRQFERILQLESEIQQLKIAIENACNKKEMEATNELARINGELEVMKRRAKDSYDLKLLESSTASQRIQQLEEQVRQGDVQRRKLHNLVQELRGNVRVYARVRPFLSHDQSMELENGEAPSPSIRTGSDGTTLKIARQVKCSINGVDEETKTEEHPFSFDRTFGPTETQESIFQEVSEFVQSALDGYNVCLFSYGQTGSGKTHTMQGSGQGSMRGIIPRAIEQVGRYKTQLEAQEWVYEMSVSFIEIYNEEIRDLLRSTHNETAKHEIKKDPSGSGMIVTDITYINVDPNNHEQMEGIMDQAARHRSVACTAMNDRSSRSHSVFTLHLRALNQRNNNSLKGSLSLVDLAGSERLDRSGVSGQQAKEAMAINKSLSALTDVFAALGSKQSHVPFRNSKLTYLLSPALSGDGKTLMMVNLSPTSESYQESLCSLRFASQVNQCELGKPRRQIKDSATLATSIKPETSLSSSTSSLSSTSSSNTSTSSSSSSVSSTPSKSRLGVKPKAPVSSRR